mmetsp:Transcript_25902/g.60157  ORF Transcript_25902/g.60157 Transcript_25902/m.60157 type:complete len:83 (-) Transcript_25902:511-759(-)
MKAMPGSPTLQLPSTTGRQGGFINGCVMKLAKSFPFRATIALPFAAIRQEESTREGEQDGHSRTGPGSVGTHLVRSAAVFDD